MIEKISKFAVQQKRNGAKAYTYRSVFVPVLYNFTSIGTSPEPAVQVLY